MCLEVNQLVVFQLLLRRLVKLKDIIWNFSTVVIVVPLLSVKKDQVKGYRTWA